MAWKTRKYQRNYLFESGSYLVKHYFIIYFARATFPLQHLFQSIVVDRFYQGADNPDGNYIFKVNNRNTRKSCEICSNLTVKGVVLVFLLLTLNIFLTLF